ncbi:hypothetical protein PRUPE_1G480900 [Prunus persica]|uniref:Uncharacterized protein n=1 Tax=Prunus persica TaxID=3760 RepID=A0A251REI5_PRUPE|nr:hypothetical protein PRUPE_1G480900 [Prunus persica]
MTAKYKAYIVQKLGLQKERAVGRVEEISTNQNYAANEDFSGAQTTRANDIECRGEESYNHKGAYIASSHAPLLPCVSSI